MFTIRDKHQAALSRSMADRFASEAICHLMTHFPAPSTRLGGKQAVQEFVERGTARARTLGVDTDAAVIVLLELWIQFGEEFERSPLREFSQNILAHGMLPGFAKVEMIRDRHQELTGGCVMIPY